MDFTKDLPRKLMRETWKEEFYLTEITDEYCVFNWLSTHKHQQIIAYVKREYQKKSYKVYCIYQLIDLDDCKVEFRQGDKSVVLDTKDYTKIM